MLLFVSRLFFILRFTGNNDVIYTQELKYFWNISILFLLSFKCFFPQKDCFVRNFKFYFHSIWSNFFWKAKIFYKIPDLLIHSLNNFSERWTVVLAALIVQRCKPALIFNHIDQIEKLPPIQWIFVQLSFPVVILPIWFVHQTSALLAIVPQKEEGLVMFLKVVSDKKCRHTDRSKEHWKRKIIPWKKAWRHGL